MSFFGDVLGFEKFNAKDMFKKVVKNPLQLVTGVDPLSTKAWNKVLGTHNEPIVDQMGGAYGGHVISAFGNKDGGVYGRAQDAGIDTKAGGQMHDGAHVIAALYGLSALGGGQGNGGMPMPGQGQQQTAVDPYAAQREEAERRRKEMLVQALRESGNQSAFPDTSIYG